MLEFTKLAPNWGFHTRFKEFVTSFTSENIPRIPQNLYKEKVNGYLMVYNPISKKAPAVLGEEAAFVLSLVDGNKTIKDILSLIQKEDPRVCMEDVIRFIKELSFARLILLDTQEEPSLQISKNPKSISVWWHITNQCNLRCKYCYVHKSPEKMSKEIARKAMTKLFTSASRHHVESILIKFAGGEPLLEFPMVIDLIHKARRLGIKHNIDIKIVIITNGVLMTPEIAQTLKDLSVGVGLSLDGLGKYNDQTRIFPGGEGSYKFIERGINDMLEKGTSFSVHPVISSKNIDGIPEFIGYCLSKNIRFTFNFYKENICVSEKLDGEEQKVIGIMKKTFDMILRHPNSDNVYITQMIELTNITGPSLLTCGIGENYIIIRHDGKLTNCQTTTHQPIGSIDDGDLIDTMRNGNCIRPRGLTVDGRIPCKDCQWKYACGGGCPVLTFRVKGRYDVATPHCNIYKALIPELLRTAAKKMIKMSKKPFFLLLSDPYPNFSPQTQNRSWSLGGGMGQPTYLSA